MKRLCPFEGYFIISMPGHTVPVRRAGAIVAIRTRQAAVSTVIQVATAPRGRSEEHTSELQSLRQLVCGLLLEKNNDMQNPDDTGDDFVPGGSPVFPFGFGGTPKAEEKGEKSKKQRGRGQRK